MPLQNRVLLTGEIVADPARGGWTGNRGRLRLDAAGRLGTARWAHTHWLVCTLTHPRGTYHGPRPARGWTPVFFHDEAVALAAGHRPCAYCRPAAYAAWAAGWATAFGRAGHDAMDRALHAARVTRARAQVRHVAAAEALPDGVFVLLEGVAHLLHRGAALPFAAGGYGAARACPRGPVTVLTPAPSIAVLAAGYPVQVGLSGKAAVPR